MEQLNMDKLLPFKSDGYGEILMQSLGEGQGYAHMLLSAVSTSAGQVVLTKEQHHEIIEYIVLSANAYPKLIKIANLAAGMIMSINTPITAKVGDNIAVPEPQAILLRKIESLLTELGEMPEKEV